MNPRPYKGSDLEIRAESTAPTSEFKTSKSSDFEIRGRPINPRPHPRTSISVRVVI